MGEGETEGETDEGKEFTDYEIGGGQRGTCLNKQKEKGGKGLRRDPSREKGNQRHPKKRRKREKERKKGGTRTMKVYPKDFLF